MIKQMLINQQKEVIELMRPIFIDQTSSIDNQSVQHIKSVFLMYNEAIQHTMDSEVII